jgi:hypothetical protein
MERREMREKRRELLLIAYLGYTVASSNSFKKEHNKSPNLRKDFCRHVDGLMGR